MRFLSVLLAAGSLGFVLVACADFLSPYAHRTGVPLAALVTAGVAVCAVGLSAVIRLISGSAAPPDRWIRRCAAGALLLAPAAIVLTRPFLNGGWDFDDCGTLLVPYRPGDASLAGFRSACDAAAGARVLHVAIWAAVGCVAAAGYGLRLRRLR